MTSQHDRTARQLAHKHKTDYNKGQGPDVITSRLAIEVETANTVRDGLRQLQGFRKPVYIAGADAETTKKALDVTKGTTVGVMGPDGKIVKRSTRKKK